MQKLIVVTGPVASGKTTVARALAARARVHGLDAASIDMDELVFMVNGTDWRTVKPTHWVAARHAAAALADAFYAGGASVVTVAGPFFGRSERDGLIGNMRSSPSVDVVALEVALEEAIARASTDPTRTLSKDPVLLAELEKTINWLELPPNTIRIRTDGLDADDVGMRAFELLLARGDRSE